MPQLYKRVEGSVTYHAHIAKLIRSIEPALTIEQRKQLRNEGQYKGQQETFPDKVDGKRKPEIANFIQQAVFKIGDPEALNGFSERQYDFTTLKSLSLQHVSWTMDPDEVDAVTRAIDFTALESVDLGHKNMRISLLFQQLTSTFSSTGSANIKLRRLSVNLGYQAFTNRGDLIAKPGKDEPGLEFLSSFDTLTSLTLCVHSADLPKPVSKDALLQGILKHENLSSLEFITTFSIRDWDTPYLDAKT
ncbi:hypothetical protein ACLX1H_010253 [Fusarium chlamydosporum]